MSCAMKAPGPAEQGRVSVSDPAVSSVWAGRCRGLLLKFIIYTYIIIIYYYIYYIIYYIFIIINYWIFHLALKICTKTICSPKTPFIIFIIYLLLFILEFST